MWYARIKRFYDAGLWKAQMVQDAVTAGKITQEECDEIVGVA